MFFRNFEELDYDEGDGEEQWRAAGGGGGGEVVDPSGWLDLTVRILIDAE